MSFVPFWLHSSVLLILGSVKGQWQTKLAKRRAAFGKAPPPLGFVETLPASFHEAPEALRAFCCPDGDPPPVSPWPLEDILQIAKEVPLRKRKDAPLAFPTCFQSLPQPCLQLVHLWMQSMMTPRAPELNLTFTKKEELKALQSLLDRARSVSSQSLSDPGSAPPSGMLALPAPPMQESSKALQEPVVPIPDGQMPTPLAGIPAQASPQQTSPPEVAKTQVPETQVPETQEPELKMTEALGQEHINDRPLALSLDDSLQKMRMARCKGSGSSGSILKKPAAAAKCLKRPASSQQALGRSNKPPSKPTPKANSKFKKKNAAQKGPKDSKAAQKAQLKQKLLARIPSSEKLRWKDGCSRCRFVQYCTISCWKLRGWR